MKEVTLDSKTIVQLDEVKDYLRLRDENGRLLGYFVPIDSKTPQALWGVKSPHSREELERRIRDATPGRPLSEFWAEMRQKYPEKFEKN